MSPSGVDHRIIWWFLLDWGGQQPPAMTDVFGLETAFKIAIAHNHYNSADALNLTAYRYHLGEARIEPLTVSHVDGTGERLPGGRLCPPTTFPQYQVTGPDGTRYLTFTVALTDPEGNRP